MESLTEEEDYYASDTSSSSPRRASDDDEEEASPPITQDKDLLFAGLSLFATNKYTEELEILAPLAQRGTPQAQVCIASIYEKQNMEKEAETWYYEAAQNGSLAALHYLTSKEPKYVTISPQTSVEWLTELSEEGMVSSTWKLYEIYSNGWKTISPCPSKAQVYFLRALPEFDKDELYELGKKLVYKRKEGSAFRLLNRAHQHGHHLAIHWIKILGDLTETKRRKLTLNAYEKDIRYSLTKQGRAERKARERIITKPDIHKE